MKIIGFTGTLGARNQDGAYMGMTGRQYETLVEVVAQIVDGREFIFHHGDAMGSDSQAHELIISEYPFTGTIEAHPGHLSDKRAFCDAHKIHPAMETLARNAIIAAAAVDGLIATPKSFEEEQLSGTWHTIRTARKLNVAKHNGKWRYRPIYIIYPDGSVEVEQASLETEGRKAGQQILFQ